MDLSVFLLASNLITTNQSVFQANDSYINRLLSVTHKTYKSFDNGLKVTDVFGRM